MTGKRGGSTPGSRPNNGGARSKVRPDDARGRPSTYWRGTVGAEARAALAVMAIEEAVRDGVEQGEAEARLLARLILAERERRLGRGMRAVLVELERCIARIDGSYAERQKLFLELDRLHEQMEIKLVEAPDYESEVL